MKFIFANNVRTQLLAAASSSSTQLVLASTANLPIIPADTAMPISLRDAATGLIREICYATAIYNGVATVLRAQEGTTAQSWNIGDTAFCGPTAGTIEPVGYYTLPVGGVLEIAIVKYSQALFPNFIPCDGVTTRGANVDPQIMTEFQETAFAAETMPILGTRQPFIAYSIAFSGSVFCAVGVGYAVSLTSADGMNWKSHTFTDATWVKIIWDGARFVALSAEGLIGLSTDGETWSVSSALSSVYTWASLIYAGGQYVAVAGNPPNSAYDISPGAAATSANGTSWTMYTDGLSGVQLADIAWNGSVYCAIAGGSVATSTNGTSWMVSAINSNLFATRIASNGSTFCVAGIYSGNELYSYTSTNGTTWNQAVVSTYDVNCSDLIFDGTYFVLVSSSPYSTGTAISAKSTDGLTWTVSTIGYMMDAVAYGLGLYVGVGDNQYVPQPGSSGPYYAFSSTNALTWAENPLAGANSSGYWSAVAYGAGLYVALQANTTQFATSIDGQNWTLYTSLPVSANWSQLVWNGTMFVAIANGSAVTLSSTNGTTWTQNAMPSSSSWNQLAYGGGIWLAVATGTTNAATSTNGTTWTAATAIGASGAWTGLAWNGTLFVLVASSALGYTTTNGTTWTGANPPVAFSSLAVGGGTFVACAAASGNVVYTSTNGSTWTVVAHPLPSSTTWAVLGYNGTEFLFVAIASGGSAIMAIGPAAGPFVQTSAGTVANWVDGASAGSGLFVMVSNDSNNAAAWLSATDTMMLAPDLPTADPRLINIMRVI